MIAQATGTILLVCVTTLYAVSATAAIVLWSGGGGGIYARESPPSSKSIVLTNGEFENIAAVTTAGQYLGVVGREKGQSFSDASSFFTIDLDSHRRTKIFEREGLLRAGLSHDGRFGAFVTCRAPSCELTVRQLADAADEQAIAKSVLNTSDPSWNIDGKRIAFATHDGLIVVVDRTTKLSQRLAEGTNATWSPDGTRLAYIQGKSIHIHDFTTQKAANVYGRYFWQTRIVGPISWNPNNVIAFNVAAGITGYEIECLLLEVKTGTVTSLQRGSQWCGPWIH